jgi:hypothetical protein
MIDVSHKTINVFPLLRDLQRSQRGEEKRQRPKRRTRYQLTDYRYLLDDKQVNL